RVSGLTIYPVKSCAGIDVDAVTVTETGFMYDRAWMLRRAKPRASVFVTQRTEPKLALVRVKLPSEVLSPSWDGILPPDAAMTITAPGMPQALEVPLAPASPLPRCKVGVWEWEGLAGDEGSEASEWFTRYLGKTNRWRRLTSKPRRRVDREFASPGSGSAFSDGYPVLLASDASLRELNERLATPVPMNRFRPNVTVDGAIEPFAEDGWGGVVFGGVKSADLVKPCSRCVMTTVDQSTGVRGGPEADPLRTLYAIRSG
ncbi:predicted protein, partial [Micromonas commoda]